MKGWREVPLEGPTRSALRDKLGKIAENIAMLEGERDRLIALGEGPSPQRQLRQLMTIAKWLTAARAEEMKVLDQIIRLRSSCRSKLREAA
jgi:hypothetical protein